MCYLQEKLILSIPAPNKKSGTALSNTTRLKLYCSERFYKDDMESFLKRTNRKGWKEENDGDAESEWDLDVWGQK